VRGRGQNHGLRSSNGPALSIRWHSVLQSRQGRITNKIRSLLPSKFGMFLLQSLRNCAPVAYLTRGSLEPMGAEGAPDMGCEKGGIGAPLPCRWNGVL